MKRQPRHPRIFRAILITSLTAWLSFFASPLAIAEDALQENGADVASAADTPEWAVDDGENWVDYPLGAQADLPSSYDLRPYGVVTPVKLQNPWGSCWAFGGIAAAETSILSSSGTTYEESKLDLSERHLTYFSMQPVDENVDESQVGEGVHLFDDSVNAAFDAGADPVQITTLFSQGIGPVDESLFPYRGKNGVFNNTTGKIPAYSKEDDWSIPELNDEGESNRLLSGGAVLSDGNVLPEYWADEAKTDNADGVAAIKRELMNGRGVSIYFYADQQGDYINYDTWCHYAYEDVPADHVVCIVGYDDDYDASNFTHTVSERDESGFPVIGEDMLPVIDEERSALTTPPGNGAWIVKNSWGSETDACEDDLGNYVNKMEWGILNEDEECTGYFYLSYYDRNISNAETLEFSSDFADGDEFYSIQHDYMPAVSFFKTTYQEDVLSTANVFETPETIGLRSVSTSTPEANMRVTFAIYQLNEGAENPSDGVLLDRVSMNFEYAGYHRINLEDGPTIPKGKKFAVVSTASKTNESGKQVYAASAAMGVSEQVARERNMPCYFEAVVNEGESFLYYNGEWYGWKEYLDQVGPSPRQGSTASFTEDYPVDNPSIKVFAVPAELNLEHVGAVEATCTTDGNIEYWRDPESGTCYKDEAGNEEIAAADTVVAALGHEWGKGVVTTSPTATKPGVRTYTCSRCGEKRTEEIPATGEKKPAGKPSSGAQAKAGSTTVSTTRTSSTSLAKTGDEALPGSVIILMACAGIVFLIVGHRLRRCHEGTVPM